MFFLFVKKGRCCGVSPSDGCRSWGGSLHFSRLDSWRRYLKQATIYLLQCVSSSIYMYGSSLFSCLANNEYFVQFSFRAQKKCIWRVLVARLPLLFHFTLIFFFWKRKIPYLMCCVCGGGILLYLMIFFSPVIQWRIECLVTLVISRWYWFIACVFEILSIFLSV